MAGFTADAAAGCFLHGTGESSHLVVTAGEINLHGLRIIPEGKTPRSSWTRARCGSTRPEPVRVVVSNSLVGEVTLWRGEIDRDLAAVRLARTCSSSRSASTRRSLGFTRGHVQVRLEHDGVRIPVR